MLKGILFFSIEIRDVNKTKEKKIGGRKKSGRRSVGGEVDRRKWDAGATCDGSWRCRWVVRRRVRFSAGPLSFFGERGHLGA